MASDHFENANFFNFIFDHFDDYAITENEHSVEENSTLIQIENDGINTTSHSFDTLLDNIGENELIFNEDVTKKDVYEVTSSLVTVPPSLFKRNHFRLEDLHTSNRFLRKPLSSLSSTYYKYTTNSFAMSEGGKDQIFTTISKDVPRIYEFQQY